MAVSGATVQAGPAKRSISGRLDWASEQFRRIPVRWRIATIVILNLAFITLLMLLIASGARAIRSAWDDLQEARRIDRLLASIENDAGRLQTLIHRYFALPNETVLNEIEQRRKALLAKLAGGVAVDGDLRAAVLGRRPRQLRGGRHLDRLRGLAEVVAGGGVLGRPPLVLLVVDGVRPGDAAACLAVRQGHGLGRRRVTERAGAPHAGCLGSPGSC